MAASKPISDATIKLFSDIFRFILPNTTAENKEALAPGELGIDYNTGVFYFRDPTTLEIRTPNSVEAFQFIETRWNASTNELSADLVGGLKVYSSVTHIPDITDINTVTVDTMIAKMKAPSILYAETKTDSYEAVGLPSSHGVLTIVKMGETSVTLQYTDMVKLIDYLGQFDVSSRQFVYWLRDEDTMTNYAVATGNGLAQTVNSTNPVEDLLTLKVKLTNDVQPTALWTINNTTASVLYNIDGTALSSGLLKQGSVITLIRDAISSKWILVDMTKSVYDARMQLLNQRIAAVTTAVDVQTTIDAANAAAASAQAAANSAATLVVVNDLTTGGTTNALSAEQGKVLNTSISELSTKNTTSVSTKNLFNPNSITVGYYVSYADGTVGASSTHSYTDYISVAASTAYVSNKPCRMIAYYDSNKAFISGVQNISANKWFKTPSTAAFMRITLYNTDISAGSVQIENGTLTTDYEPYYVLSPNKVGANVVSGNCIKDGSLSWRKSKYLTCGKNLFNKAAATQGYYINSENGVIGTSSSFYISEYIPVTAGVTYTRNIAYGTALYDANFQFISGVSNSDVTFTAPTNTVYLRASITASTLDKLQIEVGSTSTEFENFYISLSPLYVNQTESIINLPSKLYGVVWHELNIYFDNIIEDASAYKINVICTNGSQYADRWTFTPTTAGTITLSIELRKNNQLIATASTSIVVVSATVGASSTRKCMFIGDSTTAAGTYTGEIQTLATADSMSVTLLGTQGTSPNSYEAYGGWSTGNFVASGSPFYISGALNFSAYMSARGYSSVDRIVINLGINDIFSYLTDNSLASAMAAAITNINSLITSIRAFSSTVPIGIAITIPPSYSQDAFAASYQSGQTRWRYKRNLILWDKLLIDAFGGQETNNIYLIPIHTNLDTKNNMQTATINANARNTTQVTVQNNGVHPAPSGYYQIADAMYYWLKSFES